MPKPLWPYIVVVVAGVILFTGAIFFLVETVRTTGSTQYYWAFNFVLLMSGVALLLALIAVERK